VIADPAVKVANNRTSTSTSTTKTFFITHSPYIRLLS
jgi:hypothetical protein